LAAFTRGSDRGYIYIEADFTEDLRNVLRRIPGLIRTQGNPCAKFIPPSDRIHTLRLPKDRELRFTVGQWVRVLKGKYKGDLGHIEKLLPWGGVRLLIVPRLPPPNRSSIKKGKRPRYTAPPPLSLFDPLFIKKTYNIVPKKKENTYFFNGDKFEHGLLVKDFGASAVSSTSVFISTEAHSLFLQSPHPLILACNRRNNFPNPAEWNLSPGELVHALSDDGKEIGLGHICKVDSRYAEVELKSGELLNLDWHNVGKYIRVGDFVEVVAGAHTGRKGFVDHVDGCDISIIETQGEEVCIVFSLENMLSIDSLCS
jgi:transcription antitermination factor NusG